MGVWTPGPGPTTGNDVYVGDATAETVDGLGGDDNLNGGLGADTLNGGDGNDTLAGGDVAGGAPNTSGNDILNGGEGDDILIHEYTADTFNGGNGFDTVRVNTALSPITSISIANLISIERYAFTGTAGTNTFIGITGTVAQVQTFMSTGFELVGGNGIDLLSITVNAPGTSTRQFLDLSGANHVITNFNMSLQDRINVQRPDLLTISVAAPTTAPFTITGSANSEAILGGVGADILYGGGGHDILSGRGGTDEMHGGAGDDYLYASAVANAGGFYAGEVWNGGDGFDILIISTTVDLTAGNLPTISSIEGIGFDPGFNGALFVDSAFLNAVATNLRVEGAAGFNTISIELTTTNYLDMRGWTLSMWDEDDTISVTASTADTTILGSSANDVLFGNSGNDILVGGAGNDVLDGWGGNNYLDGGAGDDFLSAQFGGVGTLIGGDGFDAITFWGANSDNIYLDLAVGAYSSGATWLGFTGIEGVSTGQGNDTLFGDAGDNFFAAGNGADTIIGRGGADRIAGESGDDWLDGGDGDDWLSGGDGVNVLIGGAGIDLAYYGEETAGLWINMAAGVYSASGVWDVFFNSIEGVVGGEGNDSLFGNDLGNYLYGEDGNDALLGGLGGDTLGGGLGSDWLVGGDGDDRLIGGDGVDVLTGGAGADVFDLGLFAGWDVAFDFNAAEDRFDLGGLQWLGFITYDADGDGQSDDTLLGYAGGNFVALNVSGLTLTQWNALVDMPAPADDGADKLVTDAAPETLPGIDTHTLVRDFGHQFEVRLELDWAA